VLATLDTGVDCRKLEFYALLPLLPPKSSDGCEVAPSKNGNMALFSMKRISFPLHALLASSLSLQLCSTFRITLPFRPLGSDKSSIKSTRQNALSELGCSLVPRP
jgi:hypothetical protein